MNPFVRPRSRRGEGEALREEILEAAEALLVQTGSEPGVSIRAVADRVGVTPPSIYRHFEDKDGLMLEVCERHFAELDQAVEAAVAGIDDPVVAMLARGRAYVRFGLANPEHYRIMFMSRSSVADERPESLYQGPFAHLVDGLAAVVQAGAMEDPGDLFRAALHVWADVHGLTSLLIARPKLPWPDLEELIDDHLVLCLRARGVRT